MEHSSEEDWSCTLTLRIDDIRSLYEVISYSLEMWPGSPARPAEEQEYLWYMKKQLFAMIADYTFTNVK
tara:strand:- start:666 stop:872 length:207 start_codon:yes stop_codon:yes gene_type:complete